MTELNRSRFAANASGSQPGRGRGPHERLAAAAARRRAARPQVRRRDPVRILVAIAAAAVALVGVHLMRDIVTPLLLALIVVITVHPVRRRLIARSAPPWLAAAAVIAIAWSVLLAMLVLSVAIVGMFTWVLEAHGPEIASAQGEVGSFLERLGLHSGVDDLVGDWLSPQAALALSSRLALALADIVLAIAFVLMYVVFLALDAQRFDRITTEFGRRRAALLESLRTYAGSIRRFMLVNTVFGVIVAVLDGLLVWALGVPAPFAWAMLAFVTNYIPSIGFLIGLAPPAILAFVLGDWRAGLVVIVGYCIINVVLQSFVQPRFVSRAVRLNLTITFLSVVFWVVVLGPMGAILAVPMTLLARTLILDASEESRFARWITGDEH
ncbi:AI-2E family transporter [Leucobacter triazinivorans]|uniref:AI-2E family transporter n=1 Tax=Leucobacter triazinivorans TaxID=1784719 RepID=A0A4P6KHA9_9MICO|nr:AI-2E family transporter [Leucobacter triazinivorans]QBE48924.1 AI-2E family transporter [Leucobacter triazinivorans]